MTATFNFSLQQKELEFSRILFFKDLNLREKRILTDYHHDLIIRTLEMIVREVLNFLNLIGMLFFKKEIS